MSIQDNRNTDKLPIPYFALALGMVGLLFAAIGSWFYTGLNNRLGEWQFSTFGIYLNVTTVLIFVALIALLWRIGRAITKRDHSEENERESLRKSLSFMTISQKIVNWLGIALFISALITFGYLLLLPSEDQKIRQVTVAEAANGAEGPVELRAVSATGPTSRFRQGFLFWQRTYYFMPIASRRRADNSAEATLFIEVPARLAQSSSAISTKGLLRRDALPDEVATMYRNAKFPVAQSARIIFDNEQSSDWPARVLLYDLLLLGVMSFAFGWALKRRRMRLEKELSQS